MIVVDRHAFDSLWPALGVWLFLFITAGDGALLLRRQYALARGSPAKAVVIEKRKAGRKNIVTFRTARLKATEPVGARGFAAVRPGQEAAVHVLGGSAFLDDDLDYSRWKLSLFAAAFVVLWLWAAARYRFG